MNRVLRLQETLAEAVETDEVLPATEGAETPVSEESTFETPAAPEAVEQQDSAVNIEHLRMTEALLFAAAEPLSEDALATSLPEGADVPALIAELQSL